MGLLRQLLLARWINIIAGTLTIPVLAVCARRWWGQGAALVAALLAALSPFAVSFAPTAFTDPLLVLAGSLALALAVHRRWFWSGFWLGIAIMTKQQGLLFVPLTIACALCSPENIDASARSNAKGTSRRSAVAYSLRFLVGLAIVVLPIFYWDSLRWAVAPSPWDLGATNVGGVTLLPAATWIKRTQEWAGLLWYLLASPWAWAAYLLMLAAALVAVSRRRAPAASWLPALILAAWTGSLLLLHIITSVQVWDRYLLPLVVPLALLAGWAVAELARAEQGFSPLVARRPGAILRLEVRRGYG